MLYLDSAGIHALRVAIALIFLIAAVGKFRHLTVFRGVLENYRILPEWALAPVRVLLPALEFGVAFGILFAPSVAAPIAAILLLIFAGAMAINVHRGRTTIDCGCHQSALRQRLSWTLVWRNCVMALLALGSALPLRQPSLSSMLIGAAAGISLFILYSAMNLLWGIGPVSRRKIRIAGVQT